MKVRQEGYAWRDAENFKPYGEISFSEDVAERFAESLWSFDPCDPEYFEENIEVMDDEGKVRKFNVTAEATVIFHVEELEDVEQN